MPLEMLFALLTRSDNKELKKTLKEEVRKYLDSFFTAAFGERVERHRAQISRGSNELG